MTDEHDSPAEPPLCSICNDPMIEGQARRLNSAAPQALIAT